MNALGGLIAWFLVLALLGCEMKVEYQFDGQTHTFIANPAAKEKQ